MNCGIDYKIRQFFLIHLNEWVSVFQIAEFANTTTRFAYQKIRLMDDDNIIKNRSEFKYLIENPNVPDYYEQIVYTYMTDTKYHVNFRFTARKCLELAYPHTLLSIGIPAFIPLFRKLGVSIGTRGMESQIQNGITKFITWLRDQPEKHPLWFAQEKAL